MSARRVRDDMGALASAANPRILVFYTVSCVMTSTSPLDDRGAFCEERALQAPLPLASEGVQRWVWESQFGAMLIEIIDDVPFVNGVRVEHPAEDSR